MSILAGCAMPPGPQDQASSDALRTKDAAFTAFFPLIENGASDDRNFVKKGVSWALRGLGHRSQTLHAKAIKTATALATSENAAERWVGRDVLRDITRPAVMKKLRSR